MILSVPGKTPHLLKCSLNRRCEFQDLTLIDLRRGMAGGIQIGKIVGDDFERLGACPQSRAGCVVSAVHSAMLRTLSKHALRQTVSCQCRENIRLDALKVRSKD